MSMTHDASHRCQCNGASQRCQWGLTQMLMMPHIDVNDASQKCQWFLKQILMMSHTDVNGVSHRSQW